jgi:hypothetical protein
VDITPSGGAAWFTFYGTALSDVFCGSNGYVTSALFTTFTESVATFGAASVKKICGYWDDFNFAIAGSGPCTAYVSDAPGAEIAEFCWTNVPEFGTTAANQNTFKITLVPSGIIFDYGNMSSVDGLVGLSGATAGYVNTAVVYAAGGIPLNGGASVENPYQLFTAASPNVLPGSQITWILGMHVATGTAGVPLGFL